MHYFVAVKAQLLRLYLLCFSKQNLHRGTNMLIEFGFINTGSPDNYVLMSNVCAQL